MKYFFRIYRDRFWRLLLLNLVYFCLILPLLLLLYICLNAYTGISVGDASVADVLPGLGFFLSLFSAESDAGRTAVTAAVIVSCLLFGPLKYVFESELIGFYTGEHSFFADVLSSLRKKLPQALLFGLLDLCVLARTITNLCGLFSPGWPDAVSAVLRVFSGIVLLFWISFRRWMFLLSAGCDLRVWPLLKNSFLLTASDFGKTSQCTLACAVIWAVTFLTLPIVTVVLLPLFSYSAAALAAACFLYPTVEKRVLNKKE